MKKERKKLQGETKAVEKTSSGKKSDTKQAIEKLRRLVNSNFEFDDVNIEISYT